MVIALQTLVTRQFDVFDPVVITVGTFHAGTRRNIIPNAADLRGDGARLQHASHGPAAGAVVRLCTQIAAAYGLTAEVSFDQRVSGDGQRRRAGRLRAGGRGRLFGPERPCACPTRSWGRRTSPGCWPRCRARSCSSAPARTTTRRPHRATTRRGPGSTSGAARRRPAAGRAGPARPARPDLSRPLRSSAPRWDDDRQRDDRRGQHDQHRDVERLAAHLQQTGLTAGQRDPLDRRRRRARRR